jgi:hypothetical protein
MFLDGSQDVRRTAGSAFEVFINATKQQEIPEMALCQGSLLSDMYLDQFPSENTDYGFRYLFYSI